MKIHQITQIDESHCGPAVLAMLLDALGVEVTQHQIAQAADIVQTIDEHGARIDQLALACARLAPTTQFWYKYRSTLDDIKYLLSRNFVVGVEWQGLFYKSEEEEKRQGSAEPDYGHYSIITFIDEEQDSLVIVDPYKDFAHQDRILPIDTFERRWWDTNEVEDALTHQKRIEYDDHVLFFVTPDEARFPQEKGFVRFLASQDRDG